MILLSATQTMLPWKIIGDKQRVNCAEGCVIVVLEVMWGWKSKTTGSGHSEKAPSWFVINPLNHTGKRLYYFLGKDWKGVVTNACPELVSSAKERGRPDIVWLHNNLADLQPFDLLLVCGRVAQKTFAKKSSWYKRGDERVIYIPHPAARGWTKKGLERTKKLIASIKKDIEITLTKKGIRAKCLRY